MELDLGTTITGIILLLLIVGPIAYIHLSSKAKDRALKKQFFAIANEERLEIKDADFWSKTYGLGIDVKGQKLLYVKTRKEQLAKLVIDLGTVKSAKVIKAMDAASVDQINLVLTFTNPRDGSQNLEFYNGNEKMSLSGENQLGEKWAGVINGGRKQQAVARERVVAAGH